jgi:hypothetical protein
MKKAASGRPLFRVADCVLLRLSSADAVLVLALDRALIILAGFPALCAAAEAIAGGQHCAFRDDGQHVPSRIRVARLSVISTRSVLHSASPGFWYQVAVSLKSSSRTLYYYVSMVS